MTLSCWLGRGVGVNAGAMSDCDVGGSVGLAPASISDCAKTSVEIPRIEPVVGWGIAVAVGSSPSAGTVVAVPYRPPGISGDAGRSMSDTISPYGSGSVSPGTVGGGTGVMSATL